MVKNYFQFYLSITPLYLQAARVRCCMQIAYVLMILARCPFRCYFRVGQLRRATLKEIAEHSAAPGMGMR